MDYEFESIIPWNGEHDTGRDARQKLDRNFAKIKANFQELGDAKFVTTAFFARIFGIDGEDGAQVDINDTEAVITAVKVKFGLYSESFVSAKGKNPDAGSTPGGSTTLAGLTDVSITGTPGDGQVLAFDATLNKWTPVDMEATAGIDEEELLQILTQKGYATQQWVTQQSYAKTSVRIKAGTGLTGGGTLAQDVTLSLATVGTAGTYTKVTVDSYGRVTGHSTLTQGDIPALSISKITNLQTTLDKKLDKATFEEMFEKVWVSGYGYAIRAKLAFYSEGWISAKGLNSDAGSTTGGVDKDEVLQIVENAGYITASALNGYATQSWVNSQGFVKDAFIPRGQVLNTSVDNMGEIGAYIVNENSGLPSGAYEWGTLMTFNSLASGSYGVQMYVEDGADTKTYLRARYGGSWQSWRMLVETHNIGNYALTPSNYTNYTVTKTGSGASGTWGIGISGNAATATRLQTARTLWGQNFAGTSDVSGNLSEVGNVSLISNYTYDCGSYGIQWNNVYSRAFYMGQSRGTNYISEGNGDNATYTAYNMKIHAHWGIGITDTEDVCRIVIDSRTGSITMRGYLQIGSARLIYDSTNNALYVQNADGSQCGFYATGFMSAKGLNSDGGSAVAGATTLNGLSDVTISSPSNGQSLVYRNGVWKNEMVSGGGSASVAWGDITGKPTWIPDTDGSGSGIDADLLDGTHKSGLFTAMTYSGNTLSITIGGTRKTATIDTGGVASVTVSSSNSRNLSVTVDGVTDYVSDVYATYLDGTTKAGLFTGMTYSSNRLTVTIGGTSRSVTINAGGSSLPSDIEVSNLYIMYNGSRMGRIFSSWNGGFAMSAGLTPVIALDPGILAPPSSQAGNVDLGKSATRWKSIYSVNSLNTSSDLRLKDILSDIPLTVEQVAAASSFLYRWKNSKDTAIHAGSAAQYWQKALPQAVLKGEDGYLSMEYDRLALAAVITTARTVVDHEQRIRRLEDALKVAV